MNYFTVVLQGLIKVEDENIVQITHYNLLYHEILKNVIFEM